MGYWHRLSKNLKEHIRLNKGKFISLIIFSLVIAFWSGHVSYYDETVGFYFPAFLITFLAFFIGGFIGIIFFGKQPNKIKVKS